MKKTLLIACVLSFILSSGSQGSEPEGYLRVLKEQGQPPDEFVEQKLNGYDLLILDDGLHAAVEPFEFCGEYLNRHGESVDYIFMETFSITAQDDIDAFLNAGELDTMLLAPAFQEGYSYGWPYQTYLNLFCRVWEINHNSGGSIRIIGVNQDLWRRFILQSNILLFC